MPELSDHDNEAFSNPLAPTRLEAEREEESSHHPMKNDDFRKLLMTPRATPAEKEVPMRELVRKKDDSRNLDTGNRAENRKKRKKYYATLNHQQEDMLTELAKKYRDRAKERRDGENPDFPNKDPTTSAAGYHAVAPDAKSGIDAAEHRLEMIEKSKYLGGDMKHTHLVKGLDYSLFRKVRSEIASKEKEDEGIKRVLLRHEDPDGEKEIQFRTPLGRNIYRQVFKESQTEKNELFLPNRMAYIVDLKDAESDIPITLLRSKVKYPSLEGQTTLTTNDIVINKLAQILSYLRQGLHNKGGKKRDKGKECENDKKGPKPTDSDNCIFPELGDYVPSLDTKGRSENREKSSDAEKRKSYFEKPEDEEKLRHEDRNQKISVANDVYINTAIKRIKMENKMLSGKVDDSRLQAKLSNKLESNMPESYPECYPGAPENDIADSDDEVDYSKMDMGSKKGPVGRWDFNTQEEYGEYMSNKEATPKAAFQYGVKMTGGRRTRRTENGKLDKETKLDRELQKINQIISRKKNADVHRITEVGEPEYKRTRH